MTTDPDPDPQSDLRSRVEAANARNAQRLASRARDARDSAERIVREHPVAVIGGAIAIGAVLAAVLPRRNRRFIARKGSAIGAGTGKLLLDLAMKAAAAAASASQSSKGRIITMRESAMDSAQGMSHEIDRLASGATERTRELGENIAARGSEVAAKVRDSVSKRGATLKIGEPD